MTDYRTTVISLDVDQILDIAEITNHINFHKALGYLSAWNPSLPYCQIRGGVYDGTPELIATYRREAGGAIAYQIGAVWHSHGDGIGEGHFGFHS
jgi:hypothetical protein